ncbi:MAG: DUF2125 domain-containing protein [Pseudomonadota bacterium]
MSTHQKPGRLRRRLSWIFGSLVALILVAVSATWWVARDQIETALQRTQADLAADGVTLDYSALGFSGFPLQMEAKLERPTLTWPDGSWQGPPAVSGAAWLTDPLSLAFSAPGDGRLRIGPQDLTIDSGQADAQVRIGDQGLDTVAVLLGNARIALPQGDEVLGLGTAEAAVAPVRPLRSATESSSFTLLLRDLRLPAAAASGLGADLQSLDLAGRISGPLFPGAGPVMARIWQEGGGSLALERLDIVWGALRMEASGLLGLDQALRPQGSLNLEVADPDALLKALERSGQLQPGLAERYSGLLAGLARPRDGLSGRWVAIPLELRDGRAFLDLPIPFVPDIELARLPPLFPSQSF